MTKLCWEDTIHNTEIGPNNHLCSFDMCEAPIEIKLGEEVVFSFSVSVSCETDLVTGKKLIMGAYSPQGEYKDLFIPLEESDIEYASVEEAKESCAKKAEEVLRYVYQEIGKLICNPS